MKSIAVFYDSYDFSFAENIADRLTILGYNPWLADRDSRSNWESEMEATIGSDDCVGAIVIWTESALKNQIVKDESKQVVDLHKTLLNVLDEPVKKPPAGFGGAPRLPVSSQLVNEALEKIETKVRELFPDCAPQKRGLHLNGKFLSAPSIILSVSSYETQIEPEDSLKLLKIAKPEAVLISAYDLLRPERKGKNKPAIPTPNVIDQMRESGSIIFLDSGNYEAMRYQDKNWQRSKNRLAETLECIEVDIAFTHDKLPKPLAMDTHVNVEQRVDEIVAEYTRDKTIMNCMVAPIIHAPRLPKNRFAYKKLPEICSSVVQSISPSIIAVAERELGDGIMTRVDTIVRIRKALSDQGSTTLLHVLGTGNPISAAMLSMAGADFFDGLEWCRTAIDGKKWRLYHFQQWDFFSSQTGLIDSAEIAELVGSQSTPWFVKVALHNIAFFMQASQEINEHHHRDEYDKLFAYKLDLESEYGKIKEILGKH